MFRFKSAELAFEREADDSWFQRIIVRYRPDEGDDFRVYTPAQREQYVVDGVVLEWVTASDEPEPSEVQVNIYGRTIGKSGKADARQSPHSCFVSTVDETSINELTEAWEPKAIQLPTGWLTTDATTIAASLRSRIERARL